ncbi:ferritin-like domain-containing protein [Sphingomonas baiyangensis]|uniref:Ferritin-like domain-containing protein n=1 Tax=Sphingomonas baiyangensis TaxID=2572576 RepID=A0A4V5PTS6_9SPHN|nr:ferritin-like domain-containing protein [Sphingomonas baiyangensis]TKD51248.1 ferritin-like domain-containing protein [Sphingomonas baiyangensis]
MMDSERLVEAFDERAKRREGRRDFFRAFGAAAVMAGGITLVSKTAPVNAQSAPALTDADILNFALNLEYLEAQFYVYAATGAGLPASLLGGTGTQGAVNGGRQVNFTDPAVAAYAREIAADERAHVEFLRTALGNAAVAQPTIDVGVGPNTAFSAAARAAGLIGAGQTFDPYANDENFLLGAFIFEDVGVTAYKGASPLITDKNFLEAAAGILAVEAYHAAIVRTTLYAKGIATPSLIAATEAISDARDSLDGADDIDQGVRPIGQLSNIAPLDPNGIAYSRSAGQTLNIVYLNNMAVTGGGFFPNGVNGTIRMSAAN